MWYKAVMSIILWYRYYWWLLYSMMKSTCGHNLGQFFQDYYKNVLGSMFHMDTLKTWKYEMRKSSCISKRHRDITRRNDGKKNSTYIYQCYQWLPSIYQQCAIYIILTWLPLGFRKSAWHSQTIMVQIISLINYQEFLIFFNLIC